jgi:LmbE family N-acetylglucosaminyl deacetylase
VKKILVIVAHPDDEVLGCGGIIARLTQQRNEVYTLILGEGVTARDKKRTRKRRKKEIADLRKQARKANKILGVKKVYFFEFPDNRFDTVPFLEIVKKIEKLKKRIKPEIILTHHEKDLNIDHQLTFKAVVTATRPLPEETVKKVYSFEVLSSTEWNYPLSFSPNVFF